MPRSKPPHCGRGCRSASARRVRVPPRHEVSPGVALARNRSDRLNEDGYLAGRRSSCTREFRLWPGTESQISGRSETFAAAMLAAFLGAFLLWGVGFSHLDVLHNAAHDTRHSTGFPCHSARMAVFRRLVFAALCAGLVSGVSPRPPHQIGTVPLILEAEQYEKPAAATMTGGAHQHAGAWEPQDGSSAPPIHCLRMC